MPIVSSKGLASYTGTFTEKQLKHLYRRTHFGITRKEINDHKGKSLSTLLTDILKYSAEPSPPLNHYDNIINSAYRESAIPYGTTWVHTTPTVPENNFVKIQSFKSWLMMNFMNDVTITEKMTLFLHSFLPISHDVNDPRFLYFNYKMLRANCLGNFKTVIKLLTLDAGMLVFLNGEKNQKNAPDENYARELQELFTIGKDFTPIYSENDIKEAARVLTGFQINRTNATYTFNANRHDTGNKTFSAFYNNKVITGKTGAAGESELDELIDMIFQKDEVALHFCRKLYKFFVYYDIDDTVEANVIKPLATIMRTNNYDILPVLQALFGSEHFYDTNAYGCHIKSPIDYVLGQVREMEIAFPDSSNIETQYLVHYDLISYCLTLRQEPYDPPNVSGWEAYYQFPLYHENWITTDTIANRNKISNYFLFGYTRRMFSIKFDSIGFTKKFSKPEDPIALINDTINYMHTLPITEELRNYLRNILLYGQSEDYYWTNAWNDHINNPTDNAKKKIITDLLYAYYKYIVELAEYHLI